MRTTATNKRLRELLNQVASQLLVPNPSFQRRLVWANKHKNALIRTVLDGLPFPEIYIAAGEVNLETAQGQSMLVDGQQRITTLYEYFTASPNLKLSRDITPYAKLTDDQKREFLDYDVVTRDLGQIPLIEVKEIFQRINSTSYSLNAIEIANARYDNELKDLADSIAQDRIWEDHGVFSVNEIKRMQDSRFTLGLIITCMSDYFNRDDQFEAFLVRCNDEFPERDRIDHEVTAVIGFVKDCDFPENSRVWKKADLFTAMVEIHRLLFKEKLTLDPAKTKAGLSQFYAQVDNVSSMDIEEITEHLKNTGMTDLTLAYYDAALQATNDRISRVRRGEAIKHTLFSYNNVERSDLPIGSQNRFKQEPLF